MASIQFLDAVTTWKGEPSSGAGRTAVVPRGDGYSVAGLTQTISAGLSANASIFAMRLDPGSPRRAFVNAVTLDWVTIAAFTVPLTAGRRLSLFRGSGAATTGGTAIAEAALRHSASTPSEFDAAQGGDIRFGTTAALGASGIVFEATPIDQFPLVGVGAAGATASRRFDFSRHPLTLEPGQLLVVRAPVTFDAGGTGQLAATVDWFEAPLLTA